MAMTIELGLSSTINTPGFDLPFTASGNGNKGTNECMCREQLLLNMLATILSTIHSDRHCEAMHEKLHLVCTIDLFAFW